jgi:hypothetical protein
LIGNILLIKFEASLRTQEQIFLQFTFPGCHGNSWLISSTEIKVRKREKMNERKKNRNREEFGGSSPTPYSLHARGSMSVWVLSLARQSWNV